MGEKEHKTLTPREDELLAMASNLVQMARALEREIKATLAGEQETRPAAPRPRTPS